MRVIRGLIQIVTLLLGVAIGYGGVRGVSVGKMGGAVPLIVGGALAAWAIVGLVRLVPRRDDAPVPLTYNLQSIRNRPLSTLATAAGIALVVAIFIGGLALANGFRAALGATGSPPNPPRLREGGDPPTSHGGARPQAGVPPP